MADLTASKPAEPADEPAGEARPKVDVAAVLRALDPFWTRAINETKSLTAESATTETNPERTAEPR